MNLTWNVNPENDPANGSVGVVITGAGPGIAVRDLVSPAWARQFAAALLMAAEQISPMIAAAAANPETTDPLAELHT